MKTIIILASKWLIIAPALMPFTAVQAGTCVLVGVVTIVLAHMRPLGRVRFYWIAAGSVCLIVLGFVFRGQALAACFMGGTTLLPASLAAAYQGQHDGTVTACDTCDS